MDKMIVIETNIDDATGEELGLLMEKLIDAGANDVWYTPIYMKKSRPANTLSVLCSNRLFDSVVKIIFDESSSIGLRYYNVDRITLEREYVEVDTKFGVLKGKKVKKPSYEVIYPEHDSLREVADRSGVNYSEVKSEFMRKR